MDEHWAASAADADGIEPFTVDELFTLWLETRLTVRTPRRPLKLGTRRKFAQHVGSYLRWLQAVEAQHPQALLTAAGRDDAVQAYRAHLLTQQPGATVNVALAALAAYYDWLELGPPEVPPAPVTRVFTQPLSLDEQIALVRTAQNRPQHTPLLRARQARNLALVMVLLHGGLEESEAAGLDVDDVVLTGKSPHLWAPAPGGSRRRVELIRRARTALAKWTSERAVLIGSASISDYFLTWSAQHEDSRRAFSRLSVRQIEDIVRDLGREAGLERDIAPGVLRTTYLQHLGAIEHDPKRVAHTMGQVKEDVPLMRTLRAMPLQQHPGRPRPPVTRAEADPDQLALDF